MYFTLPTLALFLQAIAAAPTARNAITPAGTVSEDAALPLNVTSNIRNSMKCSRPAPRVTGFSKKGVAYAKGNTHWANMVTSATWSYNWFSDEHWWENHGDLHMDYIPQLPKMDWEHHGKFWEQNIMNAKARSRYEILGFNEPDMPQEANMNPQDAANAWRQMMEPYACQGFRLGAPAVSNSVKRGQGVEWLTDFMVNTCRDCTIDFVPFHIYLPATDIAAWKLAVAQVGMAARGRPIWLTEFHASGTDDQVEVFLREFIPWLDSQSNVERYSYWLAQPGYDMDGPLLIDNNQNQLSRIGNVYNSLLSH
jgi:hypothetical protein